MMLPQVGFVLLVVSFITLHLDAQTLFDEYAMRATAATRGLNGRYNSLLDFTQPLCKWGKDWLPDFIYELLLITGYKVTDICESLLPGVYDLKNFHLITQKHLNFSRMAPIVPYGMYKFEFRISEDRNPDCFCFFGFVTIVPDTKAILKKQKQINQKIFKTPASIISVNADKFS